jgi:hypothetical protein
MFNSEVKQQNRMLAAHFAVCFGGGVRGNSKSVPPIWGQFMLKFPSGHGVRYNLRVLHHFHVCRVLTFEGTGWCNGFVRSCISVENILDVSHAKTLYGSVIKILGRAGEMELMKSVNCSKNQATVIPLSQVRLYIGILRQSCMRNSFRRTLIGCVQM